MKKAFRPVICIVLAAAIMLSFSGCAKLSYVFGAAVEAVDNIKTGEWKKADEAAFNESSVNDDPLVIDEFKAGNYCGIEFKTVDDVIKYYVEAYNKTKAKTAKYTDENGNVTEMYAFADEKHMEVKDILVEGKSNAVINKLIPKLLDSLYKPSTGGLHPCNAREPEKDVDENNKSLLTCRVTAEDVLTANVTDNGDGTLTIAMQPKATEMSRVGMDPQGKFFTTLNDIGSVVEAVSVFSWASGTTEENCKVVYKGGTAVVKIDTKSGEITEADYNMIVYVNIKHANIAVVHDRSLSAVVDYRCHFPCSKEFFDKINVHPVD